MATKEPAVKRGPKAKAKVHPPVVKNVKKTKEKKSTKLASKSASGGEKKRQIGLVVKLLSKKAQTRDTLAAAIRAAGLGKDKDDKDIKNYISVMLNKLKSQYTIKSPKRGVYRIVSSKQAAE